MTPEQLHEHVSAAQEALRSFFLTISDEAEPLEAAAPESLEAGTEGSLAEHLVLYDAEAGFAVALQEGWVELISKAMLGEAMAAGDAGAEDLMSEIAAQAYGAVRTALAGDGLRLPEAALSVSLPGDAVPPLDGSLLRIAFSMPVKSSDEPLTGFAILPEPPAEAESPAAAQPAQQAAQPAAQQPTGTPPGFEAAASPQSTSSGRSAPAQDPVDVAPASFADLGAENIDARSGGGAPSNFDLLAEVEMEVTVELGRRRLPLADVLRLTAGSVIELEKLVGEPLEIYANGRLIAEGEAVVIDEQFGIRITSLAASKRQREKAFF